ncbi:MAG: DUF3791 domain-containing protein [Elusimicrobiota bacterium]|jgi:hypothetical protein|nr:DUF3791 domain-containing protein [Elusimicrobiota bacterium]
MTANKNLLHLKYARVIAEFAKMAALPADKAMEIFYHSFVYREMRKGISDMHCRSDKYLAQELLNTMPKP